MLGAILLIQLTLVAFTEASGGPPSLAVRAQLVPTASHQTCLWRCHRHRYLPGAIMIMNSFESETTENGPLGHFSTVPGRKTYSRKARSRFFSHIFSALCLSTNAAGFEIDMEGPDDGGGA